jgi:RNA polymerase sigma-70 factor (ECF subfamily)
MLMRAIFAQAGAAGMCTMPAELLGFSWHEPRWTLALDAAASEFERAQQAANERRLVEAAAAGSQAAFEALYRRHVGRVHGLCLRMTAQRETAEDCTQEAFVQAWRNLPRFEVRSSFGTWLHRIAVNTVLAQRRRRAETLGADASAEESVAETLADATASDPTAGRDLEAAIASLPPGARHVLVLAGIYGFSHEEVAVMLGIAVGTCKAQLHRARKLLGTRLQLGEEFT